MCHGEAWELFLLERKHETERRSREKAEAESRGSSSTAPPKPAESPANDREPVPA